MTTPWKIAAVQFDCRLGDRQWNLEVMRQKIREAAAQGARLVLFPECALTGYAFESKSEALLQAESVPGPSSAILSRDCLELGVWTIFGLVEHQEPGGAIFNSCALLGPKQRVEVYRKIHLPCLGLDRFTKPGDRPFAVHDLGGLRVGMNICYDGSFPEAARVLTLLGADLVVLPTNWPVKARATMQYVVQARALENHVYYAAINRVGEERGFQFIGHSRIVNWDGELLAASTSAEEEILYAEIDPDQARRKRVIHIPGKYEIDRVGDRRPEMYEPLCRRPSHGRPPPS
jgi:5-aminopentanamidase